MTEFSSTSITNMAKALLKAQEQMRPVQKDANNAFLHSRYASLAAVLDVTIDEILVTDADTSIKGMGDLDTQAVACNSNQHSGSYWMGTRDGI